MHRRRRRGIRPETEAVDNDVPLPLAGFQGKGCRDIGDDAGAAELDPLGLAGPLDVSTDGLIG